MQGADIKGIIELKRRRGWFAALSSVSSVAGVFLEERCDALGLFILSQSYSDPSRSPQVQRDRIIQCQEREMYHFCAGFLDAQAIKKVSTSVQARGFQG